MIFQNFTNNVTEIKLDDYFLYYTKINRKFMYIYLLLNEITKTVLSLLIYKD